MTEEEYVSVIHPAVYAELRGYYKLVSKRWGRWYWRVWYWLLGTRQADIDEIEAMLLRTGPPIYV